MKKWILPVLLFVIVIFQAAHVYASGETETDVISGGSCGADTVWELNSDGVLTISGTGATDSYTTVAKAPWSEYQQQIQKIIVEDGVTFLGQMLFYSCYYAESVQLPDTLTFGEKCFF